MGILISSSTLHAILTLARHTPAREVCGLLLGQDMQVIAHRPAANVAADPARYFELDPAVLLSSHRAARLGGPEVIGHYHSHPSGSIEPSAHDAAMASADGMVWMILGGGKAGCWLATSEGLHGRFLPVALVIEG